MKKRVGTRRLVSALMAFAVAMGLLIVTPGNAHADQYGYYDGGYYFEGIICGGQKIGSGWWTVDHGGYDAHTCAPLIDVHTTPTGNPPGQNAARSVYFFYNLFPDHIPPGQFSYWQIEAWIPWDYANAVMDFSIRVSSSQYCADGGVTFDIDTVVHEADVSGWYAITSLLSIFSTCDQGRDLARYDITVTAWSGMVSYGYYLGLDAIRVKSYAG
jgi:hypothetical protein